MINIDYSIIIVILNFIILLIILNGLLYKPAKKFLAERKAQIAADLNEADEFKKKANQLVQKKENELKLSAEEIRKMKKKARSDAELQANEIIGDAKDHEKKIMQETEEMIEHEKIKAIGEIKMELAEMVSELSAKFLSKKMDENNDQDMIKKMISERGNK